FSAPGVFVTSDDGALVFAGRCDAAPAGVVPAVGEVACVREARGEWSEVHLDVDEMDAGVTIGEPLRALRWIPRSTRLPLALVAGAGANELAVLDPTTRSLTPLQLGAEPELWHEIVRASTPLRASLDRRWSASDEGTIRGVLDRAGVTIRADGG